MAYPDPLHPMHQIMAEITAALDNGVLILALMGTLALPDICAALESPNGETSGVKYKAWFTANLGSKYPRVDAAEIYKLRCGMLHQGASSAASYSRVLFVGPNDVIAGLKGTIDDMLLLDLVTFCQDVLSAGYRWLHENAQTEPVKTNLAQLIRWYPTGYQNAVVGAPVLT